VLEGGWIAYAFRLVGCIHVLAQRDAVLAYQRRLSCRAVVSRVLGRRLSHSVGRTWVQQRPVVTWRDMTWRSICTAGTLLFVPGVVGVGTGVLTAVYLVGPL